MERYFDEELKNLKTKILSMGSLVESMVYNAIDIFDKNTVQNTDNIYEQEKKVNLFHLQIDEFCIELIALRQPMASDLRFITTVMKINNELERIGDQAINIVQNTEKMFGKPDNDIALDIKKMTKIVKDMVTGALDAFVKNDSEYAQKILLQDDTVDKYKAEMFIKLLNKLNAHANDNINRTVDLILITRNLEKIADHATNICEDVIFMVLGKDIRHYKPVAS